MVQEYYQVSKLVPTKQILKEVSRVYLRRGK